MWRGEQAAIEPLRELVMHSQRAACRMQALWTLELLGGLDAAFVLRGLNDPHSGVRRQAIRLAERHFEGHPALGERLLALAADSDLQIQLQRAYSLGEWKDPRAGAALGELAVQFADNPFIAAAVLSSANSDNLAGIVARVLDVSAGQAPPSAMLEQLVGLASRSKTTVRWPRRWSTSARRQTVGTRPGS